MTRSNKRKYEQVTVNPHPTPKDEGNIKQIVTDLASFEIQFVHPIVEARKPWYQHILFQFLGYHGKQLACQDLPDCCSVAVALRGSARKIWGTIRAVKLISRVSNL
ncbi:hypothetical protein OIU78_011604 [Salix suchowensis]|nr:hypothetical protein OIU78_011604 [Salix suchowensis]